MFFRLTKQEVKSKLNFSCTNLQILVTLAQLDKMNSDSEFQKTCKKHLCSIAAVVGKFALENFGVIKA